MAPLCGIAGSCVQAKDCEMECCCVSNACYPLSKSNPWTRTRFRTLHHTKKRTIPGGREIRYFCYFRRRVSDSHKTHTKKWARSAITFGYSYR